MKKIINGPAVFPAAPAALRASGRRSPSGHLLGGGPANGVYMMLSTLAMIGLMAYRRDVYSMPMPLSRRRRQP